MKAALQGAGTVLHGCSRWLLLYKHTIALLYIFVIFPFSLQCSGTGLLNTFCFVLPWERQGTDE